MKTVVFGRMIRSPRTRADHGVDDRSMEFADLLDSVTPQPRPPDAPPTLATTVDLDLALADLVMFPVPRRAEAVQEQVEVASPDAPDAVDAVEDEAAPPAKVSRFAGAGLDDDLLPVRAPRQRRLRR